MRKWRKNGVVAEKPKPETPCKSRKNRRRMSIYEIRYRKFLAGLLSLGLLRQAASPLSALAALLVWNTAGRPEPVNTPAFADVADADADMAKAAQWCVEQGLLDAKTAETFKPEGWMPKFKTIEVWEKAFPKQ